MSDSTGQLFQLNTFETGFVDGTALNIPSTDSSGIAYYSPSGNLFIADSEIAELSIFPEVISDNVFEVSLDGQTLIQSYDLTDEATTGVVNDEPTGISYSPIDDHFYITNDNTFEVYRYNLQVEGEESSLVAIDSVSLVMKETTAFLLSVVEGILSLAVKVQTDFGLPGQKFPNLPILLPTLTVAKIFSVLLA